ncbi:sugar phosphate isomerase/epimerase family protein [Streptomyces sp. NPDC050560]|uniref:sugar phosphate isomerase/epimerase family protein n=1 Tax=Streptomyces sp. NPDC050560 TaxID=3365630 RepID=UPI00378F0FE6
MPRPLGVQLYSVRAELAADRDATLARIAGLGYGAVEPYDVLDRPALLRARLGELGLAVSGAHVKALVTPGEDVDRVLDAVAEAGAPDAIVPAGIPPEDFTTREGVARAAELLNGLAERAAAHGLRLGYHNHWWEVEPLLGGRHALEVLADLLEPAVFLEVDTYWAAVGGADVPTLLAGLGERVRALHVKDGPGVREEPNVAVGSGVMRVPDVLAAAPADAWRIVEFDACAGDVFAELGASREYLVGAGAAA